MTLCIRTPTGAARTVYWILVEIDPSMNGVGDLPTENKPHRKQIERTVVSQWAESWPNIDLAAHG